MRHCVRRNELTSTAGMVTDVDRLDDHDNDDDDKMSSMRVNKSQGIRTTPSNRRCRSSSSYRSGLLVVCELLVSLFVLDDLRLSFTSLSSSMSLLPSSSSSSSLGRGRGVAYAQPTGPATTIVPDEVLTPGGQTLSSFLNGITDIQSSGPNDQRLFVVQRPGFIRIVRVDTVSNTATVDSTPFLDISTLVTTSGSEQGLLGLAFHPNYESNGYFFVHYSCNVATRPVWATCSSTGPNTGGGQGSGNSIIARFEVPNPATDDAVVDVAAAYVAVAEVVQPLQNHNSGQIQFRIDDGSTHLYVAFGDGGGANDQVQAGQNKQSLLGKILRVGVENIDPANPTLPRWSIPPSNPYVNDAAFRAEIWAWGMRNPWRFSFDRLTGDMWIGDVGQNRVEEVDFEPPPSSVVGGFAGGRNYGWGYCEGTLPQGTSYSGGPIPAGCDCVGNGPCNFVPPAFQYPHSGYTSLTGGYVYRGSDYASQLGGTYIYTDFGFDTVWGARPDGAGGFDPTFLTYNNAAVMADITTFGEDHNGELYAGRYDGRLFRIRGPLEEAPPTLAPTDVPTPSPSVSSAPSASLQPSFAPLDYVSCPDVYDTVGVPLGGGGQLLLSYSVRIPSDPVAAELYGGVLCVRLSYRGDAWLGFAVNDPALAGESMVGAQAVIGKPIEDGIPGIPKKYDLNARSVGGIVAMSPNKQTLIDASLSQEVVDGSMTTVLSFVKLLRERDESEHVIDGAGVNRFLYAVGPEGGQFSQHVDRGSFQLDFSPCTVDSNCDNSFIPQSTYCRPRICDATTLRCKDGPSPCQTAGDVCSEPLCDPCNSCDNDSAACGLTTGCTFMPTALPCTGINGNCADCTVQAECLEAGCKYNSKRGCFGSPSGGGGGTTGTCVGSSPIGDCTAPCVATEGVETSCNDSIDNDCDGLIDAADPDCAPECGGTDDPCASGDDCCSNNCRTNGKKAFTCT